MVEEVKKSSKNSIDKVLFIIFVAIISVILVSRYVTNEKFRSYIDTHVFRKEVSEVNSRSIDLDTDTNPTAIAFSNYIAILSKNVLKEYNSSAKEVASLDVNISIPIYSSNGKYLAIAEKEGKKVYLISNTNIVWNNTIEGNISKINVNNNGYVSIIINNTTYKSVIIVYNPQGQEIFKYFISNSYAICTAISKNNEYLAIGEVDYTGTIIKSEVQILSIEKAKKDPKHSIINTYQSDNESIITNIVYDDKEYCTCSFNNYVQKVGTENNERIYDFKDDDLFVDIKLNNNITMIKKQADGQFSFEYKMETKKIKTGLEDLFIIGTSLPKSVVSSSKYVALNLGDEVIVVNPSGMLVKKYTSHNQNSSVLIGDGILGVVYKNKIEVVDL